MQFRERHRRTLLAVACHSQRILIDLHAHSAPRSSCSSAALADLVTAARARGLDALCITEHDVRWSDDDLRAASRQAGMPLFPGVELTTDVGHVLVFGPLRKPLWRGYRLEELAAEVEETGAALVLPHPVRRWAGERASRAGQPVPSPEDVAALPQWSAVHAIEVASTQTTADEHALVAAALRAAPRPAVAASDAHAPDRAGRYATRFEREVRDVAGLAEEIRAGRVAPAL